MSLKDTFAKLKTTIVGTKTSEIDAKLDIAVRDIISYKTNSGRNGYIDLVKSLISKNGTMDISNNIFQQGTTPATFGQGSRLSRYNAYAAIVSHINYCQRALDVLVDNILAPDDITKTSLDVNPKSFTEDSENAQSNVKDVEEIIKKMKLEERLDMITKSVLEFGDFFCEIADEKTALTSKSAFLSETIYHIQNKTNDSSKEILNEKIDDKRDVKIIMDFSALDDIINNDDNKKVVTDLDKKKNLKPETLHFLFYDPKRVVKLQSDMFPICFGYLIFPASALSPQLMLQNQAVNSICQSILKSVEKKVPGLNDQSINTKDLQDIVSSMIKETDFTKAMNIRYVPPDRVQHFQKPSTKYYPYGESIFDSAQFNAKVLIALESAMAILRLNRSIEKRKITVEVGLPRDAAKMIERLKEDFKRRKISIDSFGSVDTIPSMITSFEDVFIPQKDGKAFVEIANMTELMADTRSKTDELKFIRDSIVSSLGVPASFLNLEENVNAKCIDLNSSIKLISGKTILLKELIDEFNETGELNSKYTYSYDIETGKIVPGKIIWAGVTRKNAKVVKITLDNGETEIVTPDHHFMLKDGSYIEAQYLKENDSLMPLYTKITNAKTTTHKTPYLMVYHPGLDTWELVHRVVAKEMGMVVDGDKLNVHHEDFNPMNNDPSNLKALTDPDHVKIHIEHKHFLTTGRGNVKLENYIEEKCKICGDLFVRHIANNQITCLKEECSRERRRLDGVKSWKKRKKNYPSSHELTCPYCLKSFTRADHYVKASKTKIITCGEKECYKKGLADINSTNERKIHLSIIGKKGGLISGPKIGEYNRINGSWNKGLTKETDERVLRMANHCKGSHLNHKVKSIEWLDYTIDTGDITVEKYHNFSLSSGIIVSNSTLSEENVLFARTIVNHQKYLTHQIQELIVKIYKIIDPEKALTILDDVEVALPAPKSLQFERQAAYMSNLANLVETLERIGIPKDWSKKKYLTSIDWDEVEKYEIESKIDKPLELDGNEGGEMGGGLMTGGMGGGIPGGNVGF